MRNKRFNLILAWAILAFPLAQGGVAQLHEHGVAEIGIAVEKRSAQIEFVAPGGAIVGFERLPATSSEKRQMESAFRKLRENMPAMLPFEASLGCRIRVLKVEMADDSGHTHDSDAGQSHPAGQSLPHEHDHLSVRALIDVVCANPLKGATLRFNVASVFPELRTLRVQVVGDDFQTGAELRGKRDSVRLSR